MDIELLRDKAGRRINYSCIDTMVLLTVEEKEERKGRGF
jgi:hypothetical protein